MADGLLLLPRLRPLGSNGSTVPMPQEPHLRQLVVLPCDLGDATSQLPPPMVAPPGTRDNMLPGKNPFLAIYGLHIPGLDGLTN